MPRSGPIQAVPSVHTKVSRILVPGGDHRRPLPLLDGLGQDAGAWRAMLVPSAHIEIEIGCGGGVFLKESAMQWPDHGFLGIEQSWKWARRAAHLLIGEGITNAAVVRAEAVSFLHQSVADHSVDALHVYFPDPWPRRRHEKRRIWRQDFVDEALRILVPGGRIVTATDIRSYFLSIQDLLVGQWELEQTPLPGSWPVTAYARKFLDRGRPVFSTMFVKVHGR